MLFKTILLLSFFEFISMEKEDKGGGLSGCPKGTVVKDCKPFGDDLESLYSFRDSFIGRTLDEIQLSIYGRDDDDENKDDKKGEAGKKVDNALESNLKLKGDGSKATGENKGDIPKETNLVQVNNARKDNKTSKGDTDKATSVKYHSTIVYKGDISKTTNITQLNDPNKTIGTKVQDASKTTGTIKGDVATNLTPKSDGNKSDSPLNNRSSDKGQKPVKDSKLTFNYKDAIIFPNN